MNEGIKTLRVQEKTWQKLNELKLTPGETIDSLLNRLIERKTEKDRMLDKLFNDVTFREKIAEELIRKGVV